MIETEVLSGNLATIVQATIKDGNTPILREVRTLGRKLKTGAIKQIGQEVYFGPDDASTNTGYIRFRDGVREHTYAPSKPYSSMPNVEVTAHLRMVVVHKCDNEGELQAAVVAALLLASLKGGSQFRINLIASSGNGIEILPMETVPEAEYLEAARLIAIDFDMSYIMGADESACNLKCDGCC